MTPIKCHNGHQFLPLPGHPERDGKPRCPGCMANLLDAASGYEPERWEIRNDAPPPPSPVDVCHDPTVCVMAHCRITRSCHRLSSAPEPVECRISRGICVRLNCPNHDEIDVRDAGPTPYAGRDLGGRDRT